MDEYHDWQLRVRGSFDRTSDDKVETINIRHTWILRLWQGLLNKILFNVAALQWADNGRPMCYSY